MLHLLRKMISRRYRWSIGIYTGTSPVTLKAPAGVKNPVLTADDVTDMRAEFIADPFMIKEGGLWYLFFEVLNKDDNLGYIAVADSTDGFHWTYRSIVLAEKFHLSYPAVFKLDDTLYMIPETYQAGAVRLYKAEKFPYTWKFEQELISGRDYVDASLFFYEGLWWMFTANAASNTLYLHYARELKGTWTEHPLSPLIEHNARIARPGGRVVSHEGRMYRFAQDDEKIYGSKLRAFEIVELSETAYREQPVPHNPVLKPALFGWNNIGMHHADPHLLPDGSWIAPVDGCRRSIVFGRNENE